MVKATWIETTIIGVLMILLAGSYAICLINKYPNNFFGLITISIGLTLIVMGAIASRPLKPGEVENG
jgi:hypothetical protein